MREPFEVTQAGPKMSIKFLDEEMCSALANPISNLLKDVIKQWQAAELREAERGGSRG